MNCRLHSVTLTLTLLLLILLVGCGTKGPVRPLAQPLPAAPPEMTLHQQGDGLLLSWSIPRTNQDGSELTDLAGFRVYRQSFDPVEDCPDCRDNAPLWRLVELDYLGHTQRRNGRLFLLDNGLEAGRGYSYKVVPFNRWGQDGPPIERRQTLAMPPPAPTAPKAKQQDSGLLLSWQAAELPEGMKLVGYQVYRRRPGRAFDAAPRNDKLLSQPRFMDSGFEANHSYVYAIRTVARQAEQVLESALSETLVVTP
ncbi:MAG: fibronectin type III domain-containing protein [Desulfuromonadaceae bacterium]|nr:fibronectin type III domain-containing protein [Desulfuromonadaceae bacterium]